jgi:hypothetical protein
MAFTAKQVANDNSTATKQLTALKVAQAAAGVEAALGTLGSALREDAQLRMHGAVALVKRGIVDGEERVEALLARVPGLGPWLAMEIFRVTHADTKVEDLPIYGTNLEESTDHPTVAEYLECIGCHVA